MAVPLFSVPLLSILLLGCSDPEEDEIPINPEPLPLQIPSVTPTPMTVVPILEGVQGSRAVADTGQAVGTELELGTDGNRIAFSTESLTASAGLIRIRFTNSASAPGMYHNVVIVPVGKEEAIGVSAIGVGEAGHYIPDDEAVLGATPILRSGESGSIVVDLPPGQYSFICTFPGHYLSMRGTLTVT